ncbi:MAG: DUF6067 family protein [Armatimonadetes bacterium]|nr:DUF6067 family protein [Armatimonadota bacterium]MDW8029449.1 DUF6067 family protein [Armatimonadota bacterium]
MPILVVACWVLILLLAQLACGIDTSDVLLYASMDGTVIPSIAAGEKQVKTLGKPVFVIGRRGQAVVCGLTSKFSLAYALKGNMNREHGSLAVWVAPQDWQTGDGKHHFFVTISGEPETLLYTYLSLDTKYLLLIPEKGNPNIGAWIDWKPKEWHHLVITWQDGEFCLYFDGKLMSTNIETMQLVNRLGDFLLLGSNHWGVQDSTAFDELLIFKRALTPEEVMALYKWADSPPEKGPVPQFYDAPALKANLKHFPSIGKLEVTARLTGVKTNEAKVLVQLNEKGKPIAEKQTELVLGKFATVDFNIGNLKAGTYSVQLAIISDGKTSDAIELEFERKANPKWLGNKIAKEDEVPIPWTAVSASKQKDGTIKANCWGREYLFDGLFCSQVKTQGVDLLAEPIRLRLIQKGKEFTSIPNEVKIVRNRKQSVGLHGTGRLGELKIRCQTIFEFDGFTWFETELLPASKVSEVDFLALEIPFNSSHATLFYSGIYYPSLDNGTGAIKPEGFKGEWRNWFWVGEEKGGIQWFAEHNRGYSITKPKKALTITLSGKQMIVRINIIDHPTHITSPLQLSFGIQATPVRPHRPDRRLWRAIPHQPEGGLDIYMLPPDRRVRGFTLWNTHWCKFLNFPEPNPGIHKRLAEQESKGIRPCLYLALAMADPREPEFRYFWEEWRVMPSTLYLKEWLESKEYWVETPICPSSSWTDYFIWLLDKAIKEANIKGLYFDNSVPHYCSNPHHGCGQVGRDGKLLGKIPILAARDFYKRTYILMKRHEPTSIIAIHMSGWPLMPLQSFCDVICDGENFGGYLSVMKAERGWNDYTHALPLDVVRAQYRNHWGPETAFLPQFHRLWQDYSSPKPEYIAAVEHLIGLFFIHDSGMWPAWSNLEPYGRLFKAQDDFGWDEKVVFVPYWNLEGKAEINADGKQPVVMSLFLRPGKVMFVPMNNTDEDVVAELKWDLGKVGLSGKKVVVLEDLFRGERFAVNGNSVRIPLPKRKFRMLVTVTE